MDEGTTEYEAALRAERSSKFWFTAGTGAAATGVSAAMTLYATLNGPQSWTIYGPMLGGLLLCLAVNWWRFR